MIAVSTRRYRVLTAARHQDPLSKKVKEETALKVKPLQGQDSDQAVEEEAKTKGGIIIPTPRKRSRRRAWSLPWARQGDGHRHPGGVRSEGGRPPPVGKYSGTDIKVDGVEHLILRRGRHPGGF